MIPTFMRRALVALAVLPLVLAAGCGSGGFDKGNGNEAGNGASGGPGGGAQVTIVGQKFTEADIMTELYRQLLDKAGFDTSVKNLGARTVYLDQLESGSVQISADYLSSMTEALNRQINGEDAATVASSDVDATLAKLTELGKQKGLVPLKPAEAEDANAYAVTKKYAADHDLTTLSDLGASGQKVKLAANSDCDTRQDCAKGLTSVYKIAITGIEPLGFDSPQTKKALTDGEVQLGQVATTDASLDSLGLVILQDDKNLQNAENLVPIVNADWLQKNPAARETLDKLAGVLTTEDLATMIGKVDGERLEPADVARDYLEEKGLLG